MQDSCIRILHWGDHLKNALCCFISDLLQRSIKRGKKEQNYLRAGDNDFKEKSERVQCIWLMKNITKT